MLRASAPAKIILSGEHAVVHGYPALAVPFSTLRATVTAEPDKNFSIVFSDHSGEPLSASDTENPLVTLAHSLGRTTQRPLPARKFIIRSDIPVASGLGSGASLATALARSILLNMDQQISDEKLNSLIYEVEKVFHGNPSGIDNTVIVYEKPVYFIRNHPMQLLSVPVPFHLLIADTGVKAPTFESVGDVGRLLERDTQTTTTILTRIGHIVQEIREKIEAGMPAQIGALMNENHALLRELTVSSSALDSLVDAALNAGALGAKLSGGGRGGNMIALVTPDTSQDVELALQSAGAVRIWHTLIGNESAL